MLDRVNLYYPAIFRREINGYSVKIPDLPEVTNVCCDGDTLEEAYNDASIQLGFYFDNEPEDPPDPSEYDDIVDMLDEDEDEDAFVLYVFVSNTDESITYAKTNAGEYIKEGLKKRNLTASEAGRILGVSEQYINYMMSGEKLPSNSMAERMALLFDFDKERFFDLIEDDDPKGSTCEI
ncbi:MAG: helix-turn-helix domain-containing protein [Clostridia bacterium]|nr:helix-turn-helix domain-containing protein [Clostridia bacterium]